MEPYVANPVCKLSWFNYKVNSRGGYSRLDQKHLLPVVDTGAGPNLISEICCPLDAIHHIDSAREIANLYSASKHPLNGLGVVSLTVIVGSLTSKHSFVVVKNIGTDVILGCSYTDVAVPEIHCHKKQLLL